jgi:death on curing protein
MNWQWLERDVVLEVHQEQLLRHGGGEGIRDEGLLDSALAKPQQLAAYGDPSVYELAAAYAFGISKNHPFIDGNKRTAWIAARLFLLLHGFDRAATDEQCYLAMIALAAGESTQAQFANWLRSNTKQV